MGHESLALMNEQRLDASERHDVLTLKSVRLSRAV